MKFGWYFLLTCWSLSMLGQSPPRLLILTTGEFSRAAHAIQQDKEAIGIATEILLTETVSHFPSAEALRAACRNRHKAFPFDHLLLLGDAQHIPPFAGLQGIPHDHGYSLADDKDALPDWAVGRLPFNHDKTALAWWQRQQSIRQSPYNGGDIIISASLLNRDDEVGQQLATLAGRHGMVATLYRQAKQNHNGDSILAQLKKGSGWAIYYGHGDAVGWNSLQPGIATPAIQALQLPLPTMILSAACDNANFTYEYGASLGESFISAGAMGFVGCTGQCLYDYSDTVTKYTFLRYLESPMRTIGEALRLAKHDCHHAFYAQSKYYTRLTLQHFVLLGDPTAQPPVQQLMAPRWQFRKHTLCITTPQVFWGWQRDTSLMAGGITMENDCIQATASSWTLGIQGRHTTFITYTHQTIENEIILAPNPAKANATVTLSSPQHIAATRWIYGNGQSFPANGSAGSVQTPAQPGVWLLEVEWTSGSRSRQKVVVLP